MYRKGERGIERYRDNYRDGAIGTQIEGLCGTYTGIHMYIFIYIYIYWVHMHQAKNPSMYNERERDREKET